LHSGYEILQACTQPTKLEVESFLVLQLFGKNLSYDDFNEFLNKGKKNLANFEHYDLRDDNELDPNIW
jgi:hypothetical protein